MCCVCVCVCVREAGRRKRIVPGCVVFKGTKSHVLAETEDRRDAGLAEGDRESCYDSRGTSRDKQAQLDSRSHSTRSDHGQF